MSSSSFNQGNRSAFNRLCAASTCCGVKCEGASAHKWCQETSILAQLEKAVEDGHDSARLLNKALDVMSQVRFANQASAEVRVSDVDRAVQMAHDVADRIGSANQRAQRAQVIQFSAAKFQRLLAGS